MDEMDLQLQSLIYEKAHLVKEIAANRDFVYEDGLLCAGDCLFIFWNYAFGTGPRRHELT